MTMLAGPQEAKLGTQNAKTIPYYWFLSFPYLTGIMDVDSF